MTHADGARQRYYSMSAQIEAERKTYHARLERQQRASVEITDWLDWFLGCLGRALERAEGSLENVL